MFMKTVTWIFAPLLSLLSVPIAWAQPHKPAAPPRTIAQEVNDWVAGSEKQLVAIAEDMPEDKYNFVPAVGEFRGVRNFGKQVKHVGAALQVISAGILGEAVAADAADERGPDAARTKAEILKYLKDSYAYLHRAVETISEKSAFEPVKNPFGQGMRSRVGLVTAALVHSSNHYGQMVEYLRMNGLTPRSSN